MLAERLPWWAIQAAVMVLSRADADLYLQKRSNRTA